MSSNEVRESQVGDDYNAMIKKMLTFEKCGINIARSDATLQVSLPLPLPLPPSLYETAGLVGCSALPELAGDLRGEP